MNEEEFSNWPSMWKICAHTAPEAAVAIPPPVFFPGSQITGIVTQNSTCGFWWPPGS